MVRSTEAGEDPIGGGLFFLVAHSGWVANFCSAHDVGALQILGGEGRGDASVLGETSRLCPPCVDRFTFSDNRKSLLTE